MSSNNSSSIMANAVKGSSNAVVANAVKGSSNAVVSNAVKGSSNAVVSNAVKGSSNAVVSNAAKGLTGISNTFKEGISRVSDSTGLLIGVMVLAFLLFFVIIYLFLKYFYTTLKYNTIIKSPILVRRNNANAASKSDADLPELKHGNEYAYSFWLYLNEVDNGDQMKVVFRRGTVEQPSPIVYLDKRSNKLFIKVKTNAGEVHDAKVSAMDNQVSYTAGNQSLVSNKSFHEDNCFYMTLVVDYVPLQRWTHIVFTVDKEFAVIYVDGEIYKVINHHTQSACDKTSLNVRGLAKTKGDVFVGSTDTNMAADAALSRLVFFNHSLSINQVQSIYAKGPMKSSLMRKLGISQYGVRNPVYRLDGLLEEIAQE
jgi:hypothetical protein